jgi:hypothetical protein
VVVFVFIVLGLILMAKKRHREEQEGEGGLGGSAAAYLSQNVELDASLTALEEAWMKRKDPVPPAQMVRDFSRSPLCKGVSPTVFYSLSTETAADCAQVKALTGIDCRSLPFEGAHRFGAAVSSGNVKRQATRGNLAWGDLGAALLANALAPMWALLQLRAWAGCVFWYEEWDFCKPHADKSVVDYRIMARITQAPDTEHYFMVQAPDGTVYNIVFHGPFLYHGAPNLNLLSELWHAVPSAPMDSGVILTLLVTNKVAQAGAFGDLFIKALVAIEKTANERELVLTEWKAPEMDEWAWSPANIPAYLKGGGFEIMRVLAARKGDMELAARLEREKKVSLIRAESGACPPPPPHATRAASRIAREHSAAAQ